MGREAEGRRDARRAASCRSEGSKRPNLGEASSGPGVVSTTPGQKIAYVVDVAYHAANARAIVDLVRSADLLFIEAPFLEADARTAAVRGHLTASQTGRLAREAAVKQVIPIHFSPRYVGQEQQLRREAQETFLSLPATP